MSDLVKRLRGFMEIEGGDIADVEAAVDRIEQLERVLAQARESMSALDLLFRPLARDCTAMIWIDKNTDAIAAIDEALK